MEKEDLARAIESVKKKIPSIDVILDEALHQVEITKFGETLKNLHDRAEEIYHRYERDSLKYFAELWIESRKVKVMNIFELYQIIRKQDWEKVKEKLCEIFVDFAEDVQKVEKILGNMRKARAGRTLEKIVFTLLVEKFQIPCQIPKGNERRKLKNIDLVSPSIDTFWKNPKRSIFLAVKRTLRERWKEEISAAKFASKRGSRCWLVTIDENIPSGKAEQIFKEGIDRIYAPISKSEISKIYPLDKLPEDLRKIIN